MPRWSTQSFLRCFVSILATVLFLFFANRMYMLKRTGSHEYAASSTLPYANISHCERNKQDAIDCPDVRSHKGDTRVRKSQLVITRMLRIFDLIARKFGLRYWLARGTLLGAFRGQGFIPWDTDADIEMPYEDWLKFVEIAETELPDGMFLQTLESDPVAPKFKDHGKTLKLKPIERLKSPQNPRLRDLTSCYMYCLLYDRACSWHDGLMIDIFVVYTDEISGFATIYTPNKVKTVKVFPLKEMKFEGFSFPVPNQWEEALNFVFHGDLKLPPLHKRRLPDGDLVPNPLESCGRAATKLL